MTHSAATCDRNQGHPGLCTWDGKPHIPPPTARTDPRGNGWITACPCGWQRYDQRRPIADKALHEHKQRCKKAG